MKTDRKIYALGFFDGVHLGHQVLLAECRQMARELGCKSAAITFDCHPKSLFMDPAPMLISTAAERRRLLTALGIEHIREYPVSKAIMSTPWKAVLEDLVRDGAVGFVCGSDFRFGKSGEGNAELLKAECDARGIPCVIVPEQRMEGIRISSSHIRAMIEEGLMESAVKFLGHPYVLTGVVCHGIQLGRKLGMPTANLELPRGLAVPKFGVYACVAVVDGVRHAAVTNIGIRPTVNGRGLTVEAWILDFKGDLYDRELTLEFYRFLRPERRFPHVVALRRQIETDAAETRLYLEEHV